MAAKNPFPGMNPYLEQRWGDVHHRLVSYSGDLIQDALPDDLRARVEERVFVESATGPEASYYPDVLVQEWADAPAGVGTQWEGAVAVAEPMVLATPHIERREGFIQIIDARSGGRVITMIEFLSPSNKRNGSGRDEYGRKQAEAQKSGVNLVEIDLLRRGLWTTLPPEEAVPPKRRGDYHATVFRASRTGRVEYYPFALRQRLPGIRIPLRPTDPDVALDLQALVDLAYQRGRYDDIDYRQPLNPPLPAEDAAWAQSLLKERGLAQP